MKKQVVMAMLSLSAFMIGCGNTQAADESHLVENIEVVTEIEMEVETIESVEEENTVSTEAEIKEDMDDVTEEVAETTEKHSVTELSATKYAKSEVNVRSGASSEYDRIGSLKTNQQVSVTGQADTGWYRIDYNGQEGYVSNNYLVDEKVVVNTAPVNNNGNTASSSGSNAATNSGNGNANAGTGNNVASNPNTDANSGAVATPSPSPDAGSGTVVNPTPTPTPVPSPSPEQAPVPETPQYPAYPGGLNIAPGTYIDENGVIITVLPSETFDSDATGGGTYTDSNGKQWVQNMEDLEYYDENGNKLE